MKPQSKMGSYFDVCDQDSQGLHEAYVALFDENGEFQSELNLDDHADTLIFIWRAVVHPRLLPYLQGVLATVLPKFEPSVKTCARV